MLLNEEKAKTLGKKHTITFTFGDQKISLFDDEMGNDPQEVACATGYMFLSTHLQNTLEGLKEFKGDDGWHPIRTRRLKKMNQMTGGMIKETYLFSNEFVDIIDESLQEVCPYGWVSMARNSVEEQKDELESEVNSWDI